MYKQIASSQNNRIKQLLQLREKSRNRKKEQLFIIEGIQEILFALQGGYKLIEIYFCPEILPLVDFEKHFDAFLNSVRVVEISIEVYQKIAYRATTEGLFAIAQWKDLSVNQLTFKSNNPLILVAEAPEKPGNIGALLRSADAANVDAILIANPKTDIYNPNIIRSSVGCIFTTKIGIGTTSEIIEFLNQKQVTIYTAIVQEALPYTSQNYSTATAIVVGTEHDGLSDEWRRAAKQNIIIPMEGKVDSMNVSVAAGILIFEAKRQRSC